MIKDIVDKLADELIDDVKVLLTDDEGEPNESVLKLKLKNAIREVIKARGYLDNHDEEFIENDLQNYIANIIDLTMYDYNQIGVEGEQSHNENGTSRSWKNRNDCLSGICKYVKLF